MSGYHRRGTGSNRILATGVAALLLTALGLVFNHLGQQATEAELVLLRAERGLLTGDYQPMRDAVETLGERLADDERAPASLRALDARAELIVSLLYTGSQRQRERARLLLEDAKVEEPLAPTVLITEALVEATIGDPSIAATILDSDELKARYPEWARVATAASSLRRGERVDAAALAVESDSGLGKVWAVRTAWQQGDAEAIELLCKQVAADKPNNTYVDLIAALAASRLDSDQAGLERLKGLIGGGQEIPAVLAGYLVIDLTRAMRREGEADAAAELLQSAVDQDSESLLLQAERAREARFRAHFGVAFDIADKGLRVDAADSGLLAELAGALYFRDSTEKLETRLRPIPDALQDTDGVVRARALGQLLAGQHQQALTALEATRHVGQPGDTELWIAEAHLRLGQAERALREAHKARHLLVEAYGEESYATAIARLYEALAVQGMGDTQEARRLADEAYAPPYQTPWAAWLYGRLLEGEGETREAKDLYLKACHHGQDFALSCYELSRIYRTMKLDAVAKRTQKKAQERYLQLSPKGVHAVEIGAALRD